MSKHSYAKYSLLCLALLLPGILIVYFHHLSPFIFQTNDDVYLNAIIAGEVTGSPSPHMIHIGYPVGLLLSMLYNLFPAFPWYGIFLCSCIGITLAIVLYKLISLEKKVLSQILTLILCSLGIYAFIFLHIVELQYTFVTTFVSAGGVFILALFVPDDSLKKSINDCLCFFILTFISCCIRDKACIILFPFILMILFIDYCNAKSDNEPSNKGFLKLNKKRINIIAILCIYFAMILCVYCIKYVSISSEPWTTFYKYNSIRESIVDYSGFPDYDTNQSLYDSLGISKSSYEAICYRYGIAFEPNINVQSMTSILNECKSQTSFNISDIFAKTKMMILAFWDRHIQYTDRPLNLLVYCIYIVFFICSILGSKKQAVLEIIFTGIARMIIWTYLMYIGRYPARVTQGIYIAELFILLGIAWKNNLWSTDKNSKIIKVCWSAFIILFVALSFRFGIPKAIGASYESKGRIAFSESYTELKTYFKQHPDNFYYLDNNSFGDFTRDALTGGKEEYGNFMLTGSWLPKSPLYDEKLKKEKITDFASALFEDSHVYIVFMDSPITGYEYLEAFYQENYNKNCLVNIEDVQTSNGLIFHIMKVH